MNKVREYLKPYNDIQFIYSAIYYEGWAENEVNFYFEDVRKYVDPEVNIVIYEWNIFHHNEVLMDKCLYDIDGVFCVEPPDERNDAE